MYICQPVLQTEKVIRNVVHNSIDPRKFKNLETNFHIIRCRLHLILIAFIWVSVILTSCVSLTVKHLYLNHSLHT